MKNTKQAILKFAKSKVFWLKDFDKTNDKRGNYRKKDQKTIYGAYLTNVENYLDCLQEEIVWLIYNDIYFFRLFQKDMKKAVEDWKWFKTIVNRIKTVVNSKTISTNNGFIERLLYWEGIKCTKNHNFAIPFYTKNYETINKAMKKALIEIVEIMLVNID